ncbi:hypothetical protein BegalDRAFT_0505 [Beggiatoa alba B18LD]|uniref:Lysozyme inhibitor LprI-like N-terminal domain-containing protein n=2 Tax=Beggiatoa alba TaxID=1022 RepID=I3CCT0_9GAMM|nr:hypothetical protein BegalDRAFT_0505 [Beggiatoa alba B18LD]
MHLRTLFLYSLPFLFYTVTAVSAEGTPKVDCNDPQSTYEINYCAEKAYQSADAALNRAYKNLMNSGLSAEEQALLKTAQRTWIKFRDEHCEYAVYGARGGTGFSGFLNACLQDMTEERIRSLEKSYLE